MSCIYVIKSLRSDKEGEKSYPVYKIGKTKEENSSKRTANQTFATCDSETIAEIKTPAGKESRIENIMHKYFQNQRIKRLDNKHIKKSEWFKISWNELKEKIDEICFLGEFEYRDLPNNEQCLTTPVETPTTSDNCNDNKQKIKTTFEAIGLKKGDEIFFGNDKKIVAVVEDSKNKITYNGKTGSISNIATEILRNQGRKKSKHSVNGFLYFFKNNEKLFDMRKKELSKYQKQKN